MVYFVGLFTSSLVSYSEKLSSLNTSGTPEDMNSPVMHDAVPTQHELLPFHGGVPVARPAPRKSLRHLTFKNGVVGTGNTVPPGTMLVERGGALPISGVQIRRVLCCVVD